MSDQPTTPTEPTVLTAEEQAKYQAFLAAGGAVQGADIIDAHGITGPDEISLTKADEEPAGPPMFPDVINGKPRFQVVEANLHVQTLTEGELVLRLDIPTKIFRTIGGDQEELDQLFTILEALGDKTASDKLSELGILETMGIVVRFFDEFGKKAQATMGEASRSSK